MALILTNARSFLDLGTLGDDPQAVTRRAIVEQPTTNTETNHNMRHFLTPVLCALPLAIACSGAEGGGNADNPNSSGTTSDGDTGHAATNAGGAPTGGPGSGGSGSRSTSSDGGSGGTGTALATNVSTIGGGGTGGQEEEACVTETTTAYLTPPVLQLVVDRSGSMNNDVGDGQTRWQAIVEALEAAMKQTSDITAIGVSYFPVNTGCQVSGAGSLPIGLLEPEQRNLLETSLEENAPFELGGTPTEDAFAYAVDTLLETSLEGPKYVVLLTDGSPTYAASLGDPATATKSEGTCNGSGSDMISEQQQQDLVDAVAAAREEHQIGTFVIGAPGTTSARPLLSRMAEAGGTATTSPCGEDGPDYCHFDLNSYMAGEFVTELTSALADITGSTLSCSFEIPPAPGGKVFELNTIGVELTVGDGEPMMIERDPSETACNTGWQVSSDLTHIELCSDVCALAQQGGSIDIVYKCNDQVR